MKKIGEYFILGPNCVTVTIDIIIQALENIINEEMDKSEEERDKDLIEEALFIYENLKMVLSHCISPESVREALEILMKAGIIDEETAQFHEEEYVQESDSEISDESDNDASGSDNWQEDQENTDVPD